MSRSRTSALTTTTIHISDGDWIEVKDQLNAGEKLIQDSLAMVPTPVTMPDGNIQIHDRVDWSRYEVLRTHLWLVRWSLVGTDNKSPLPLTIASIDGLDTDTFDEINTTVYNHIMKMLAEKKRKKSEQLKAAALTTSQSTGDGGDQTS